MVEVRADDKEGSGGFMILLRKFLWWGEIIASPLTPSIRLRLKSKLIAIQQQNSKFYFHDPKPTATKTNKNTEKTQMIWQTQ